MRRVVALVLVAACGETATPSYVEVALVPSTLSTNLDLLFVLDDSPGTLHLHNSLKAAFPVLLDELAVMTGELPSLHIGVVTSDLGTKGYNDAVPGPGVGAVGNPGACSGDGMAGRLHGTLIYDVSDRGALIDAFASIATVGSAGCGFEQPLEAMRIALIDANNLVRADARLGVIAVQDEDDCSFAHSTLLSSDVRELGPLQSFRCTRFGVTCDQGGSTPDEMNIPGEKSDCRSDSEHGVAPIERYREFLASMKTDERDVMFATIAGVPEPFAVELRAPPGGSGSAISAIAHSCTWQSPNGTVVADPAVRMHELTSLVRRGRFEGVCQTDLAPALRSIGRQLRSLLGDTCLTEPLSGQCKVFDESAAGMTHELQPCSSGAGDCYDFVQDVTCGGGVRLAVTRSRAVPRDTMMSVRCPP